MKGKRLEDKKNKNNRRKNKKTWKKVLIIILMILTILAGWFAYRTYKNGGGLGGMLATVVGHNENTKKDLKEIKVLILGVSTSIEADLTDTIMVASYNPNTQTANLLSIPRDTFTGKYKSKATASQKINALYNIYGGPEKTLEAVNEITGLDIQYYVVVKTQALIDLVDAIGGVEFNVPIDMKYDDTSQDLHIDLKAGEQKIDGKKAEQLLRFRHSNYVNGVMTTYPSEYGNDDFGRMRTQRDFIVETLKQTLKPGNIFKIGQILDIANKNVDTNLELSFVKDYIPYAVEFNTDNLQTATLPGTTPDLRETNNVSVFITDKVETEKLIKSMFKTDETELEGEGTNTISNNIGSTSSASKNKVLANEVATNTNTSSKVRIELLNGSGDSTKLEEAKKILEDAGYEIKKTGKHSSISKTIITNKKDTAEENLKNIKNVLGTGSISTNKSSTSLVDVTVVIGKDF